MCLEVAAPSGLRGKYCSLGYHPISEPNQVIRLTTRKELTTLQLDRNLFSPKNPILIGTCVPNSCRKSEVLELFRFAIKDFPIVISDSITCDTEESNSWTWRFQNFTTGQKISSFFVSTMIILVMTSSVLELLGLSPNSLKPFSAITNTRQLSAINYSERAFRHKIDYLKMLIMLFVSGAHIYHCMDVPLGFFILSE